MYETSSEQRQYTYYAFISYKREDSKWANWLKRGLQTYRLPVRTHRQHPTLPRRLNPIFLDRTNLTPGYLDDGLRSEVQDSKFLIVICSHYARKQSTYLDMEIRDFLEGGGDPSRIIPFIVEASGKPEEECFPEALRVLNDERAILGANIYDSGRHTAFLKTVAYMQGLKLEELESEDTRQRRRRRQAIALCACALAAVFAAAACYCWDYFMPKTEYYVDYVERYGVPEGIGQLSEKELPSISAHYVLISREHKVRELRYEDGQGNLMSCDIDEYADRPIHAKYEYRENGVIDFVTYYTRSGKTALVLDYDTSLSTADLMESREQNTYSSSASLSAHASMSRENQFDRDPLGDVDNKSSISRYLIDYDENGFVRERRYASDSRNSMASDADGIGGLRFDRDTLGRVIRITYLIHTGPGRTAERSEDYEAIGSRTGIAFKELEYDSAFNLTETRYFDNNGPAFCEPGYARRVDRYENHNCVETLQYGADGNPVYARGWVRVIHKYDSLGKRVETRYLDQDGAPTLSDEGFAVRHMQYDDRGNLTEQRYFGVDDQPILCKEGFSVWKGEYDERDNLTCLRFFDTEDRPTRSKEGYARLTLEYDTDGNVVCERYFDGDDAPTLCGEGCAALRHEYDEQGNPTRHIYLGIDGQPVLNNEHYAILELQYDDRGNEIKASYLGVDGQPILQAGGYAATAVERDACGIVTEGTHFGTDGTPIISGKGYASWKSQYDICGNLVEVRYFNREGWPVLNRFGYAGWKSEFDAHGNVTSVHYFGVDGALIQIEDGFAGLRYAYDEWNRQTRISFFDAEDSPVLIPDGYAVMTAEYNPQGSQVTIRYFNEKNEPVLHRNGYAFRINEYDNRGNMIRVSFFDLNGAPVLNHNGCAGWTNEFDARDNEIKRRYFGTDGQPILLKGKYAVLVREYDERDNEIINRYLGLDDAPILLEGQISAKKFAYDVYGNQINVVLLGPDGKPLEP